MKVATDPAAAYDTVPATATPPGPASRKVEVLIDAGLMALLKVAMTGELTETPVAPCAGDVDITAGRRLSGTLTVSCPQPAINNIRKMAATKAMLRLHVYIFEPQMDGGLGRGMRH
jgi:hypothetical protein